MHLYKASQLGDVLIVIVGTDEMITTKKGFVYQPLNKRIEKVMEIGNFIDKPIEVVVSIDTDGTCSNTIRNIKPTIFAKGGDRTPNNMPESEIRACREVGCEIQYGIGEQLDSSSNIIRRHQ